MRILTQIGLVIGLLLLIALLVWQGAVEVFTLLASSGWVLLVLPLAWLPSLLVATLGWLQLFNPDQRPGYVRAAAAMWMGRAVNNLLPTATIGGEVAKARLIYIWGTRGTVAAASVIVDKTGQVISVILWGLCGVALLAVLDPGNQIAMFALAGFGILTIATVGFILVQRAGMFGFLAQFGEKLLRIESLDGLTISAREVDAVVRETYARRRAFARNALIRTLALAVQTAEVWAACLLLGHPIGILEALMLRSLTVTISDIAFIIPNAYGIQEGAFIVLGALVGLPAEAALAVSLSLRIRDVLLDPVGLLVLHQIEARRWLARPPGANSLKRREGGSAGGTPSDICHNDPPHP
jgi:putative membrane protein